MAECARCTPKNCRKLSCDITSRLIPFRVRRRATNVFPPRDHRMRGTSYSSRCLHTASLGHFPRSPDYPCRIHNCLQLVFRCRSRRLAFLSCDFAHESSFEGFKKLPRPSFSRQIRLRSVLLRDIPGHFRLVIHFRNDFAPRNQQIPLSTTDSVKFISCETEMRPMTSF